MLFLLPFCEPLFLLVYTMPVIAKYIFYILSAMEWYLGRISWLVVSLFLLVSWWRWTYLSRWRFWELKIDAILLMVYKDMLGLLYTVPCLVTAVDVAETADKEKEMKGKKSTTLWFLYTRPTCLCPLGF